MTSKEQQKYKVLRVTQLDADQIDNSIYNILRKLITDSLKYKPFSFLLNFEPELNACLRLVLWNFSIRKTGKSIGQTMLGTQFVNRNGHVISNIQKYGFAMFAVVIQWFKERQRVILKLIALVLKSENMVTHIEKSLTYFEFCTKILSFLNLLYFLNTGMYVSLLQRILGLQHRYTGKPSPRYINYEYSRKEMIWENLTQMTFCLLPFLNFRKVLHGCSHVFATLKAISPGGHDEKQMKDCTCVICLDSATNPYVGQCGHIFCYYCIKTQEVDGSVLKCYVCFNELVEIMPVEFLEPTNNL